MRLRWVPMIKVTIKEAAKKRGIQNAYQFGQKIEVADKVAASIWNNTQEPKLKTLNRICNALGCGLEELIVYKPDRNRAASNGNGHTSPLPRKRSSGIKRVPKTKAAKLSGPKRSR